MTVMVQRLSPIDVVLETHEGSALSFEQVYSSSFNDVARWIHEQGVEVSVEGREMQIHTLEGPIWARPGDWIIRGVDQEIYPCKDHIFRQTYERAEP